MAGAALSLLAVSVLGLWLARKPVAERFIDDALRARGVVARYEIVRIGLRTQRLSDVRIGDPARPDLLADWVEVDTGLWSGLGVAAIRAGHVRLRATLAGGRLSFGAVDRLLPAPSGKPFALPAVRAELGEARIALATPAGDVALAASGAGRLDDGFAGTVRAAAAALDIGGCRAERLSATLALKIDAARPALAGPVALTRGNCRGVALADAVTDLSVALDAGLRRWNGTATLMVAQVRGPGVAAQDLRGRTAFAGSARDVAGTADVRAGSFAASSIAGREAGLAGRYRYAAGRFAFDGTVRGVAAALAPAIVARLDPWRTAGAGTPAGPIAAHLAAAIAAAARSGDVTARVSAIVGAGKGQVVASRLGFASASGVRAQVAGDGISYRWPGAGVRIDGEATLAGGGMPTARIRLAQASPGAPVIGHALVAPYAAGAARLDLMPVDFVARPDGATRIATRATLSGPLGDGRVDGLRLPLSAAWDGRSGLVVDPGCVPLSVRRLRAAGFDLPRSAVTLCPQDGELLRLTGGGVRGGGRIGPVRLGGRLGEATLTLALRRAEWRWADRRFSARGIGVRLGAPERATRLDIADLDGGFDARGATGRFAGAGGQIGTVPLLLAAAAGQWRFAGGTLALDGSLQVADAAAAARFHPLAARDVALTLVRGRIATTGTLIEPKRGVKVADVAIAHDLADGTGHADLTVPGIAFGTAFQPDALTPLTFGVIADVAGTVAGVGHIRWSPGGVTSDGVFRTAGTDLAAAFGPVTGIAGEVHFTDLLTLASAPGQVATIRTLNPGVPVDDGTIRYQVLPGTRIAVEQGRWAFAGGVLTLDPTILDFGAAQERRMTFRVTGMAADRFLQQFDFKNLDATGTFDGVLPMVFDAAGGRIERGRLVVRDGGGTIAYVGEISRKDLGFWGNLAFQALKSLKYRKLDIVMNGPLAGEMVTEVRFAGVGQGAGAKRNIILDRLQKLPFVFNVRIQAPFRQLIDSAQSFYDPKRLIERNLPALLEERDKRAAPPVLAPPAPVPARPVPARPVPARPVQPSDSGVVP